jgi:hypothetical protein
LRHTRKRDAARATERDRARPPRIGRIPSLIGVRSDAAWRRTHARAERSASVLCRASPPRDAAKNFASYAYLATHSPRHRACTDEPAPRRHPRHYPVHAPLARRRDVSINADVTRSPVPRKANAERGRVSLSLSTIYPSIYPCVYVRACTNLRFVRL